MVCPKGKYPQRCEGGWAGWGATDTILSEKKLNPHGKSVAALQMVGAVKGGIFRFTMKQGEAQGAISRPTGSINAKWWLFISRGPLMPALPYSSWPPFRAETKVCGYVASMLQVLIQEHSFPLVFSDLHIYIFDISIHRISSDLTGI